MPQLQPHRSACSLGGLTSGELLMVDTPEGCYSPHCLGPSAGAVGGTPSELVPVSGRFAGHGAYVNTFQPNTYKQRQRALFNYYASNLPDPFSVSGEAGQPSASVHTPTRNENSERRPKLRPSGRSNEHEHSGKHKPRSTFARTMKNEDRSIKRNKARSHKRKDLAPAHGAQDLRVRSAKHNVPRLGIDHILLVAALIVQGMKMQAKREAIETWMKRFWG